MITANYGMHYSTDKTKTEELFAIFATNPASYVSGWKLARVSSIGFAVALWVGLSTANA
jgi:hypothetical protein